MDFYYGRNSGNSARAAFGLFESGAPFEPRQLNIKANQNREPAYLAINPMGKIPALVDEGIVLWESNAINWYVAERYPMSGLLPESIEGRAAVQRWLFFQTAHMSPGCIPVFRATNPRLRAAFGEPDAGAPSWSAFCRCSTASSRAAIGSSGSSRWPTSRTRHIW